MSVLQPEKKNRHASLKPQLNGSIILKEALQMNKLFATLALRLTGDSFRLRMR